MLRTPPVLDAVLDAARFEGSAALLLLVSFIGVNGAFVANDKCVGDLALGLGRCYAAAADQARTLIDADMKLCSRKTNAGCVPGASSWHRGRAASDFPRPSASSPTAVPPQRSQPVSRRSACPCIKQSPTHRAARRSRQTALRRARPPSARCETGTTSSRPGSPHRAQSCRTGETTRDRAAPVRDRDRTAHTIAARAEL
jgi:hypothetical protein